MGDYYCNWSSKETKYEYVDWIQLAIVCWWTFVNTLADHGFCCYELVSNPVIMRGQCEDSAAWATAAVFTAVIRLEPALVSSSTAQLFTQVQGSNLKHRSSTFNLYFFSVELVITLAPFDISIFHWTLFVWLFCDALSTYGTVSRRIRRCRNTRNDKCEGSL
jgi:hypothetical protein